MKKYFDEAVAAYDLNSYIPVEEFNEFVCPKEMTIKNNPESLLIEKEKAMLMERISEEAKTIIGIIIDAPDEMRKALDLNKGNVPSLRRIVMYAEKKWGKKKARLVIHEVATYTIQIVG